jgi:hypothetical protein
VQHAKKSAKSVDATRVMKLCAVLVFYLAGIAVNAYALAVLMDAQDAKRIYVQNATQAAKNVKRCYVMKIVELL